MGPLQMQSEESNPALWADLLHGRAMVVESYRLEDRVHALVVAEESPSRRLTSRERRAVQAVCQGAPYKVIAFELGVAVSTARAHAQAALEKMGLHHRETAVWVASSLRHARPSLSDSGTTSGDEGTDVVMLSARARPDLLRRLSEAERAVTLMVLDGRSNGAIAQARGATERTVANQVAAAFRKLNVSGRLQLVRKMFEPAPATA